MGLLFRALSWVDKKHPFTEASAHCDIPCKIYDPISAQLAVLSMIRMVDLLDELKGNESLTFEQQATFNRLVGEKETHGKQVKNEVRVIWGDYIKQPQLDAYPELHKLVHDIMLLTSSAKQHINRATTVELLAKVNRFAEIFWLTKGVSTYKAVCPYPPSEILIYPVLSAE